jgi:hypothetical protein
LIKLLDQIIERRCLQRRFALLQLERVLAVPELEEDCSSPIDPKRLFRVSLALSKTADLGDLLIDVGRELISALKDRRIRGRLLN